jgi:hypothetical protein
VGLIRSAACHRCAEGSNVHDSDEEAGSNVQDSALPKSDLRVKCLVAVPPAPGFRFGGHFVALAVRRAFCVTGRCTAPTRGPNIRGWPLRVGPPTRRADPVAAWLSRPRP